MTGAGEYDLWIRTHFLMMGQMMGQMIRASGREMEMFLKFSFITFYTYYYLPFNDFWADSIAQAGNWSFQLLILLAQQKVKPDLF